MPQPSLLARAACSLAAALCLVAAPPATAQDAGTVSSETLLNVDLVRAAIGGVAVAAFSDGETACAVNEPRLAQAAAEELAKVNIVAYLNGPSGQSTANPVTASLEIIVRGYDAQNGACVATLEICNAGSHVYDDPIVYFDRKTLRTHNFSKDAGSALTLGRSWKSCIGSATFFAPRGGLDAEAAANAERIIRAYAGNVMRTETKLRNRFGAHFEDWRETHHDLARAAFGY